MLRDLTIKNYRCFKDFSIDGLARVNLIVGQNNSGKTSFLEAVYLLVNQGNPDALIELLDIRGEYTVDLSSSSPTGDILYSVAHIFRGHEPLAESGSVTIDLSSSERSLTIAVRSKERGFDLQIAYSDTPHVSLPLYADYSHVAARRFSRLREGTSAFQFVPTSGIDFDYLSLLWDTISLDPDKEDRLVGALRLLDQSVEDVRFTTRRTASGAIMKLRDYSHRIPLSSMGEGMRRVAALTMSALVAENGILLVDEIDSGLYHGVQADMWRLLIEIAQRFNLQIFATTHSWDCVEAFQDALRQMSHLQNGEPLGLLFRLETRNGVLRKVKYDARDLEIAVEQDIEVR